MIICIIIIHRSSVVLIILFLYTDGEGSVCYWGMASQFSFRQTSAISFLVLSKVVFFEDLNFPESNCQSD